MGGGITLEFGHTSGSGTDSLLYNYIVTGGQNTDSLLITNWYCLCGGTIRDQAGNDANLELPALGTPGHLTSTSSIIIDTSDPTVSSVSSTKTDGYYNVGDTLAITVAFNEPVVVTGAPQLTLETGSTDAVANYSRTSNDTILIFDYIIASGNTSGDLDYASTAALSLNNGTIQDVAGNNATLTLASPG